MFQVSMIKISNIKSIFTWDTDQNKLVNFDNYSIYLDNDKIYKITKEDLPFDQEIDAENAIITPGLLDALAYPSAICVPVLSSLTPINFIFFS